MTSYLWRGKIYTSLANAPQAMIDTLVQRGLAHRGLEVREEPDSGSASSAGGRNRHYEPDDLTIIDRLGPAREEDLNERGIFTIEDLANADLDVVEAIDGVSRAMAVAWIAEAQSLLEGAA